MSGQAGSAVAACFPTRTAAAGSGGVEPGRAICQSATREVVAPPHDGLGVPGRAARVEEHEVVAARRTFDGRARRAGRDRVLVRNRARVQPAVACVRDLQPEPWPSLGRQEFERLVDGGCELVVEDDGGRVGVVEQVGKLVPDVAVVHVHGHRAEFLGREERLEVLGPVQALDRDLVAFPDPAVAQEGGQPGGSLVERRVGEVPGPAGDRDPVGRDRGDIVPGPGERVIHGIRHPARLGEACRYRANGAVPWPCRGRGEPAERPSGRAVRR